MLSAVIFDFDGVIVDTEPLHFDAFAQVVDHKVMPPRDVFFSRYVGLTDAALVTAIYQDHGTPINADQSAALRRKKNAAYEKIVGGGLPLLPGVANLIRILHSKCPLAICSGARRSEILAVLQHNMLTDYFAQIVSFDDGCPSKPDPAGYKLTVLRLGNPPAHLCFAIEDSTHGIAAARTAGLRVLAVQNSAHGADQSAADRIVADLSNVTTSDLEMMTS